MAISFRAAQRTWFQYMAEHMNDIVDAYSEHVYWDYWDTPKIESRLRDIRKIVSEELPVEARKPIYITEYGVRGIQNFPGKPTLAPGYWSDGTQITRTNVAAFQQLWFNVMCRAARVRRNGEVGRLLGQIRQRKPGALDHWSGHRRLAAVPDVPRAPASLPDNRARLAGSGRRSMDGRRLDLRGCPTRRSVRLPPSQARPGALTVIGLDTNGRLLNEAASQQSSYSIGGLPAFTTFNLAIWNGAGDGLNQIRDSLTTNVAGVARFDVPLHGAFALTTVPVRPSRGKVTGGTGRVPPAS